MRCKPGDLAIVVNDFEVPENNGALVKVLARARPEDFEPGTNIDWECEAVSTILFPDGSFGLPGNTECGFRDRELRPLRPSTKQDETLTWAPRYELA